MQKLYAVPTKMWFVLLFGVALLIAFPIGTEAGALKNNSEGELDGRYMAKITYNSTKEVIDNVKAEINGLFLTLYLESGTRVCKISEFYDRRFELEVQAYDSERGMYMTCALDDGHNKLFNLESNSSVNSQKTAPKQKTAVPADKSKSARAKMESDNSEQSASKQMPKNKNGKQKERLVLGIPAPATNDGELPSFYGR